MLRLAPTIACLLALAAPVFAGLENSTPPTDIPALVRTTVDNEVSKAPASGHFMFRGTNTTPKGSTTKLYVESREGTAGMAIAYNGKPLTPEQRQQEEARVTRFVTNPEELKKKRKQEMEEEDRSMRIIRAIPDAFLFEYAGEEPGTTDLGKPGDQLVKLNFRPNPQYDPPSHVEQILTGMQGVMLIDAPHHRLALIDGTLFREVGFGWGILGRLNRGGHFLVQQRMIGENRWEVCRMNLAFEGKILLLKHFSFNETEVYSDYRPVPPDLSFAQALEMIKKEQATMAQNSTTSKLASK
jgi:hypothetical protein